MEEDELEWNNLYFDTFYLIFFSRIGLYKEQTGI